jgi:hypothetical protein
MDLFGGEKTGAVRAIQRNPDDGGWVQVYRLRWYAWIPFAIADRLADFVIGAFCLAGIVLIAGGKTGLIPAILPDLTKSGWIETVLVLVLYAGMAWLAFDGLIANLLDLIRQPATFEGRLDGLQYQGKQGEKPTYTQMRFPLTWSYFLTLTAGEKRWIIRYGSLKDRFRFEKTVQAGMKIRLDYRQGTGLVTGLWVKPGA